jgi:hypothetical protein
MNNSLEHRRKMNQLAQDAKDAANEKELSDLESAARAMGFDAKARHLDEHRELSETAIIALATGLAQIYLHQDLERLDRHDAQIRALLYVSFFMERYEATIAK